VAKQLKEARDRLSDFNDRLGPLKKALQDLNPDQMSMYDKFVQLNQITPELSQAITDFGGNIADFQEYANLRQMSSDFESIMSNFTGTKEQLDTLGPIFAQFGANLNVLSENSAAIKGLQAMRSEFAGLNSELDAILPKQTSMIDNFLKTGQVTPDMAAKIAAAGGDVTKFQAYGSSKSAITNFEEFLKQYQSKTITQDELIQYISAAGNAQIQALIQNMRETQAGAFDSGQVDQIVSGFQEYLKTQQINAAVALKDQLGIMDGNINAQIAKLQAGIETELAKVREGLSAALEEQRQKLVEVLTNIETSLTGNVDTLQGQLDGMKQAIVDQLGIMDTNINTTLEGISTALTTAIDTIAKNYSEGTVTTSQDGSGAGNGQQTTTQQGGTVIYQNIQVGSITDYAQYKSQMDKINNSLATGLG
jgi:hypothetical protein